MQIRVSISPRKTRDLWFPFHHKNSVTHLPFSLGNGKFSDILPFILGKVDLSNDILNCAGGRKRDMIFFTLVKLPLQNFVRIFSCRKSEFKDLLFLRLQNTWNWNSHPRVTCILTIHLWDVYSWPIQFEFFLSERLSLRPLKYSNSMNSIYAHTWPPWLTISELCWLN